MFIFLSINHSWRSSLQIQMGKCFSGTFVHRVTSTKGKKKKDSLSKKLAGLNYCMIRIHSKTLHFQHVVGQTEVVVLVWTAVEYSLNLTQCIGLKLHILSLIR